MNIELPLNSHKDIGKTVIIFGHPRSRTNLACSHRTELPTETFDLSRLNENLSLDFSKKFNVNENIFSGRAHQYLEKLKTQSLKSFKIFGYHLNLWPEAFSYISSLQQTLIVRIYRENKFEAILSLLLGSRRGWSSNSQRTTSSFHVGLLEFTKAFDIIVTQDNIWSPRFTPDLTLEYHEVPSALASGELECYGFAKTQIHRFEFQNSIENANRLIDNIKEVQKWYELMSKEMS